MVGTSRKQSPKTRRPKQDSPGPFSTGDSGRRFAAPPSSKAALPDLPISVPRSSSPRRGNRHVRYQQPDHRCDEPFGSHHLDDLRCPIVQARRKLCDGETGRRSYLPPAAAARFASISAVSTTTSEAAFFCLESFRQRARNLRHVGSLRHSFSDFPSASSVAVRAARSSRAADNWRSMLSCLRGISCQLPA